MSKREKELFLPLEHGRSLSNLNLASFGYMVKILFRWDNWLSANSTFGFAIPMGNQSVGNFPMM